MVVLVKIIREVVIMVLCKSTRRDLNSKMGLVGNQPITFALEPVDKE